MAEWPTEEQILLELRIARFDRQTDGWRSMAEIAGTFETDFSHVAPPLSELVSKGFVDRRDADHRLLGPGATPLYRALRNGVDEEMLEWANQNHDVIDAAYQQRQDESAKDGQPDA